MIIAILQMKRVRSRETHDQDFKWQKWDFHQDLSNSKVQAYNCKLQLKSLWRSNQSIRILIWFTRRRMNPLTETKEPRRGSRFRKENWFYTWDVCHSHSQNIWTSSSSSPCSLVIWLNTDSQSNNSALVSLGIFCSSLASLNFCHIWWHSPQKHLRK